MVINPHQLSPISRGLFLVLLATGCARAAGPAADEEEMLRERARDLARSLLIVDGHVDIPMRLHAKPTDITELTGKGDFDFPRAREGGLDAPFMSIYTSSALEKTGGSKELADELIDVVEGLATDHPDKFALAFSVAEMRENFARGLISLPMGMENGAPLGEGLVNLQHFYDRGIRYVTFAHAKSNLLSDAAYDEERPWGGLSPLGERAVEELNRLGVMVDVSHLTDEAFYDVVEISRAPVIASHSSCRSFTPGWERNMSDDQIRRLGESGGVMLVNFGSSFLDDELRQEFEAGWDAAEAFMEEKGLERSDPEVEAFIQDYRARHPPRYADSSAVLDHIDHVIELAGVDHVGFGSDFEGVGDSLPVGLKDVSSYPNLIYGLLRRGYSEEEIEKICSGNLLRVWSEAERVAAELKEAAAAP